MAKKTIKRYFDSIAELIDFNFYYLVLIKYKKINFVQCFLTKYQKQKLKINNKYKCKKLKNSRVPRMKKIMTRLGVTDIPNAVFYKIIVQFKKNVYINNYCYDSCRRIVMVWFAESVFQWMKILNIKILM